MNPDTIPLALLPWLAWHLGIDAWKDYWPEQVKRARVKAAISIARKNGTAAAVREVVAAFGGNIALREWFQMTPHGKPGTFDVVLTVRITRRRSADRRNTSPTSSRKSSAPSPCARTTHSPKVSACKARSALPAPFGRPCIAVFLSRINKHGRKSHLLSPMPGELRSSRPETRARLRTKSRKSA